MARSIIGVIGGSGLYQMAGLENVREVEVKTPFGKPSDKFVPATAKAIVGCPPK